MLLRSHATNSLAELILKTAAQGHTTYEDLLAAASEQIQVIAGKAAISKLRRPRFGRNRKPLWAPVQRLHRVPVQLQSPATSLIVADRQRRPTRVWRLPKASILKWSPRTLEWRGRRRSLVTVVLMHRFPRPGPSCRYSLLRSWAANACARRPCI